MSNLSKSAQKRVTKVNDFLLKTFKTTSDLNSSLKRERILPTNQYLENGKKTLELLNTMPKHKTTPNFNHSLAEHYAHEVEVKSLEHYKRAEPNEKIANMIREQKDRRRENHFLLLNEYEKVVKNLYKNVQGEYDFIKEDVESYFKKDNTELLEYFKQFDDQTLISLDKTFLENLSGYTTRSQDQRGEKIINLLARLTDVEHKRERSMIHLLDELKNSLIENAYYLQNQVVELIKEEEVKYEEIIAKRKEENEAYVDQINDEQRKAFEDFEAMSERLDKRWRKLHHETSLRQFMEETIKEDYTNPFTRNEVYRQLKRTQVEVFESRKETLKQMAEISPDNIKKNRIEKMLETTRELNDTAQATYDRRFEELFTEHNSLTNTLKALKEDLKEKLLDIAAELDEGITVESIIEGEIQERVQDILTKDKSVLSEAIACIEENDLKANELLSNLLNFYVKLGTMQDTLDVNVRKAKFDYELEKAKLADENDENLERLNGNLDAKKKDIKEAVHHAKLEGYLEEGFKLLDDIENEFRVSHDKNLEIVQRHPVIIRDFILTAEKELAAKFQLVDESKEQEIKARYQKEAEDKITKMIEDEEKQKEEEEELKAQQDKNAKKPAKAPAKKDPKKQQKEAEERRAQLVSQVAVRTVQVYDSPMNTHWLYKQTLGEFVREFFCIKYDEKSSNNLKTNRSSAKNPAEDVKPAETGEKQPQQDQGSGAPSKEEDKVKYFAEWTVVAPQDVNGVHLLSNQVSISFNEVSGVVHDLMLKMFGDLDNRKEGILEEAEESDKEFVETSIILLDQRLKAHYPLKGRLETEIYQTRASEIVDHKKRYERHVRMIVEKLDNQTEEFNLLLEEGVESLKTYEQEQQELREALTTADSISRMDGIQNQAKDKTNKFGENNTEITNNLKNLAIDETNKLLQANKDFIKNLQLFQNGGNFSVEEVAWYEDMLKEIDEKIKVESQAREKRNVEIQELLARKKQQLITQFEGEYVIALEELCAKDGTGKKYGKPKRVAQERLRTEMNKCERAQEAIEKLLNDLKKQYDAYKEAVERNNDAFFIEKTSLSLEVRKNLAALRSCIARYSVHIDAIKKECPVEAMPRITFIEERLGLAVTAEEVETDNKRKEEELELLGPLYYQKETKKFTEWILDIETNIKAEAQKLYTDKNVKFLTGADKIPDYLRTYLESTKRQMEEFRNSFCRKLRESCLELSDMAENINTMVFESLKKRYLTLSSNENREKNRTFDLVLREMEVVKECHIHMLRPNLSNPSCKDEFDKLNEEENKRLKKYLEEIETTRTQLEEDTQSISNRFFKALVNNFEFLILYFDRTYLFEDFNRVTGDDDIQKKRANLKTLMKTKLTGVTVDRTTERCIEKKWPGFPLDSFMLVKGVPLPFDEEELLMPSNEANQQKAQAGAGAAKGKQPPKKEEKKGKEPEKKAGETGNVDGTEEGAVAKTREVPSFKTYRQKTCYQSRNRAYNEYKQYFEKSVEEVKEKFTNLRERELKYQFQWERSIDQIFYKA